MEADNYNELTSNPDMSMLMESVCSADGGYAWESYNRACIEITEFFDIEKHEDKTILILSISKLKAKSPEIDEHCGSLNSIDERISFNEYKWVAKDLAKLGIDINVYIIQKLIERHNSKKQNNQLKLSF